MRLHGLMFNMQIECKQELKCKLKSARISLYTEPHDNSFRASSMFHIQFISCEMTEIREFNSNDTEKDLNNVCSKRYGTLVYSKEYDSRNCKEDVWVSYKSSRIIFRQF
jgi:hypothetical protein